MKPEHMQKTIRRALAFHNMPGCDLEQTALYKWPSRKVTCEFRAVFRISLVETWAQAPIDYDGCAAFTRFLYALNDCFCSDIKVTGLHYEPASDNRHWNGRIIARFYCNLTADKLLPDGVDGSTTRNALK